MKIELPEYTPGELKRRVEQRLKYAHFPYLEERIQAAGRERAAGLRVLDVGCGPGNVAEFCAATEGVRWFGVDLWDHQLAQASQKQVYENLFQMNLAAGLPFKDGSFDLLICNEVLLYLPNAAEMIAEFHRILDKGGEAFIYNAIVFFPNTASNLKRLARKVYHEKTAVAMDTSADWRNTVRPSRIAYFSYGSLTSRIEAANFRIVDVTGFRLFRSRLRLLTRLENYEWYRSLVRRLSARFPYLASDLMVAASKDLEDEP